MKELVEEWYDTLADHAKGIQTIAFESGEPKISARSSRGSIWDLIPSRRVLKMSQAKGSERTSEDAEYEKLTWGFVGLALGSVVAYFTIMGSPIHIVIGRTVEEEDEEDKEGLAMEHDHLEELADIDDE
jgi:sorting and assembly machinery component 37